MTEFFIKHAGALIFTERLRRLANLGLHDFKTDLERELCVALQDALVLARIYRGGKWIQGERSEVVRFEYEVDVAHQLDVLAKREAFATPAPWILDPTEPKYVRDQHMNKTVCSANLRAEDAELIVEMRNALPFLLASRRIADRQP